MMYCRIFPAKSVNIGSWILGCIAVSWAAVIAFVCVFQCKPVSKAWDHSRPGYCIDLMSSFIGGAIPNIVTDVAILALPMPQVWKLRMTTPHRISLTLIFLLGSL